MKVGLQTPTILPVLKLPGFRRKRHIIDVHPGTLIAVLVADLISPVETVLITRHRPSRCKIEVHVAFVLSTEFG